MATLKCPHCDTAFDGERTWSQAALSTLVPAPAVPDLATQVRCSHCGRVSAASDFRSSGMGPRGKADRVVWLVIAAAVAWAFLELVRR